VYAPQWRKEIMASVKTLLQLHGFRCSGSHFWKFVGDRRLSVQLFGGSLPHDTSRLEMWVFLGLDFVGVSCELTESRPPKAHQGMWSGQLYWIASAGFREFTWTATSQVEALELAERIKAALPPALESIEQRFETWHDLLMALCPNSTATLNPPGRVKEYLLPKVV